VFRDQDLAPGAPGVAVVNRPFVDRVLGGRNPIGRRLRAVGPGDDGPPRWYRVVGVVPDLGLSVADPERAAGWYLPIDPGARDYYLALRTAGSPPELVEPLRLALAGVDPEIDVYRTVPLERVGWEDRAFMSGFGSALTGMGVMAMILSLAGIYAMLSFAVTRRTREIGVRMALGATGRQVLRAVVGGTGVHLLAGAALGGVLAVALTQARQMLVTRLPAGEPWILPAVVAVLLVAGLVASWVPCRRVLAIRPTDALRS
jgi:predicted lysophospholipase L1 biosynthesis ABC-type transport system permease subunit